MAKDTSSRKQKSKRKKPTVMELLREHIDVEKLLDSIPLHEEELIAAALDQPELAMQANRWRVQRMHVRVKLETELETLRARVGHRYRRMKDASGRREFTDPAVKERVELDPQVIRLQKKLNRAIVIEELSKNLKDVFFMRSDSIRTIVQSAKVSIHMKELELLRGNRRMTKLVAGIRESWGRKFDY